MARNVSNADHSESQATEPPVSPVSPAAAAALNMERALTARETGVLLGLHEVTLQQWRARGEGPRFIKLGAGRRPAIRYILRDVLAFRNARAVGKAP